jgi:TolA-binding protein
VLRLEHEVSGLRRERRTDVAELQQKINKVDREVGELRASIELNNQQLTRIDAKLDRVIERQNP